MLFKRTFSFLSILAVFLTQVVSHRPWYDYQQCLSDEQASFLANIFVSFSVGFDPNYAGQFLADDFTLQSDSYNALTEGVLPIGGLTSPNKTAFLAGAEQLTTANKQPPATILNLIHSCNEIIYRYVSESKPPIQGIQILYVRPGTQLIEKSYLEFDGVAFLIGAGLFPCKS